MKNSNTTTEKLLDSHPEWEVMHLAPSNAPEMEGEYILCDNPYIDGTNEAPYYTALALLVGHEVITPDDVDGDEDDYRVGEYAYYRVYWDIIPEYADEPDAWRHCDWDRPLYIEYLGTI